MVKWWQILEIVRQRALPLHRIVDNESRFCMACFLYAIRNKLSRYCSTLQRVNSTRYPVSRNTAPAPNIGLSAIYSCVVSWHSRYLVQKHSITDIFQYDNYIYRAHGWLSIKRVFISSTLIGWLHHSKRLVQVQNGVIGVSFIFRCTVNKVDNRWC